MIQFFQKKGVTVTFIAIESLIKKVQLIKSLACHINKVKTGKILNLWYSNKIIFKIKDMIKTWNP
jgi:hypothetical protein